jgi:hypothetical protein
MLYQHERGQSHFGKDKSYFSELIRIGKNTIFPENPKNSIKYKIAKNSQKFDFALAINIECRTRKSFWVSNCSGDLKK